MSKDSVDSRHMFLKCYGHIFLFVVQQNELGDMKTRCRQSSAEFKSRETDYQTIGNIKQANYYWQSIRHELEVLRTPIFVAPDPIPCLPCGDHSSSGTVHILVYLCFIEDKFDHTRSTVIVSAGRPVVCRHAVHALCSKESASNKQKSVYAS